MVCQIHTIVSSKDKITKEENLYLSLTVIPVISFYISCGHRLVLSSVSDYFAAMFTNDVREARQEEIKMEGVDPNALWALVQYAYTGNESDK